MQNLTIPSSNIINNDVLINIKLLQNNEKKLLKTLDITTNNENRKAIIEQINNNSKTRIHLYETILNNNTNTKQNILFSKNILTNQQDTINIVENELDVAKQQLQKLEAQKNNKIRMIEINNYYEQRYSEHSILLILIIKTMIPIIILSFVKKYINNLIYYILLSLISIIGSYYIWIQIYSILMRSNMNYQKYDWKFNSSNAPTNVSENQENDPWTMPKFSNNIDITTCIGQGCCSTDQIYDVTANRCKTHIN
jgi:hypothetical protein